LDPKAAMAKQTDIIAIFVRFFFAIAVSFLEGKSTKTCKLGDVVMKAFYAF